MAKKLTLIEFVNALLPASVELRIAEPRPAFRRNAGSREVRRTLLAPPKGLETARRRLRVLAKRASSQTGERRIHTWEEMIKIQRAFLKGKAVYPAPASPWVRLDVVGPKLAVEQDGFFYTERSRKKPVMFYDRWPKGGAKRKVTPGVIAAVEHLRAQGLKERAIPKQLEKQGIKVSRGAIRNNIPRPQ